MNSLDLMWAQLLGTVKGLPDSGRCTSLAGAKCVVVVRISSTPLDAGLPRTAPLLNLGFIDYVQHMRIMGRSTNSTNQKQGLTLLAIPLVSLQYVSVINSLKVSQRAGPLLNFPMNEPTLHSCFLNTPE